MGPKTAAKWLQEYGSLDGVKQNAEKIRGKAGETLRASFADVDLSLKLATITPGCSAGCDPRRIASQSA